MSDPCEGTFDLFAQARSFSTHSTEAYLLRWLRARYEGGVRTITTAEIMDDCRLEHRGIRGGSPATWERAWRWIRNAGWVHVSKPKKATRNGETYFVWTLLALPPREAPEYVKHGARPTELPSAPSAGAA